MSDLKGGKIHAGTSQASPAWQENETRQGVEVGYEIGQGPAGQVGDAFLWVQEGSLRHIQDL